MPYLVKPDTRPLVGAMSWCPPFVARGHRDALLCPFLAARYSGRQAGTLDRWEVGPPQAWPRPQNCTRRNFSRFGCITQFGVCPQ
jgi:hypothetical protein